MKRKILILAFAFGLMAMQSCKTTDSNALCWDIKVDETNSNDGNVPEVIINSNNIATDSVYKIKVVSFLENKI